MNDKSKIVSEEDNKIIFAEFLENVPPSQKREIDKIVTRRLNYYELITPELILHCDNDACNGKRYFRCDDDEIIVGPKDWNFEYLKYSCSNCQNTHKYYSIAVKFNKETFSGECVKFGELPQYGPNTPSRLIKLIGPDRELFLKGRRCENLGLGIGAFVYYRRVIENQKNRILDEIIKVGERTNLKDVKLQKLIEAKNENQFSKALENVKDAIPPSLKINGSNPLSLLHSALSDGLHDQTDEHCLNIASSIRIVLAELSERISVALKDEVELKEAIKKLQS